MNPDDGCRALRSSSSVVLLNCPWSSVSAKLRTGSDAWLDWLALTRSEHGWMPGIAPDGSTVIDPGRTFLRKVCQQDLTVNVVY